MTEQKKKPTIEELEQKLHEKTVALDALNSYYEQKSA